MGYFIHATYLNMYFYFATSSTTKLATCSAVKLIYFVSMATHTCNIENVIYHFPESLTYPVYSTCPTMRTFPTSFRFDNKSCNEKSFLALLHSISYVEFIVPLYLEETFYTREFQKFLDSLKFLSQIPGTLVKIH